MAKNARDSCAGCGCLAIVAIVVVIGLLAKIGGRSGDSVPSPVVTAPSVQPLVSSPNVPGLPYAPFDDHKPTPPVEAAVVTTPPPTAVGPTPDPVAIAQANFDAAHAALNVARDGTDQAALGRAVTNYYAARDALEKAKAAAVAVANSAPPAVAAQPALTSPTNPNTNSDLETVGVTGGDHVGPHGGVFHYTASGNKEYNSSGHHR